MQLLPGEQKLSESSDGTVLLTSYRVRLDEGGRGRYRLVSIMLDQVASCSIQTRSYPILILLGAVFALATFQMTGERLHGLTIGVGAGVFVLCVLVYWYSRENIILISSAGEAIRVRTRGMRREAATQFVDDVERARLQFRTVGKLG